MTRRLALLALLLLLCSLSAACTQPPPPSGPPIDWTAIDTLNAGLPEGVRVYAGRNDTLPLRAWHVRIDEPDPAITTRIVVSDDDDRRESTASFAADLNACVAVNGGYFTMNENPARHVGLLLTKDSLVAPATDVLLRDSLRYETARAALGFTEDGHVEIGWALTRHDTLFTLAAPPAHRPGTPAPLPSKARPWGVREALGAGPALIQGGKIWVTADEEVFFGTSIPNTHPRTAAGRTANGDLLLLVVDGRQESSRGVNLTELAGLLLDLGAVDALNLDGGGSSTLLVNGTLLNRPTGGTFQREVMSALVTTCGDFGF